MHEVLSDDHQHCSKHCLMKNKKWMISVASQSGQLHKHFRRWLEITIHQTCTIGWKYFGFQDLDWPANQHLMSVMGDLNPKGGRMTLRTTTRTLFPKFDRFGAGLWAGSSGRSTCTSDVPRKHDRLWPRYIHVLLAKEPAEWFDLCFSRASDSVQ